MVYIKEMLTFVSYNNLNMNRVGLIQQLRGTEDLGFFYLVVLPSQQSFSFSGPKMAGPRWLLQLSPHYPHMPVDGEEKEFLLPGPRR